MPDGYPRPRPTRQQTNRQPLLPDSIGGPVPYRLPTRGWNRTMYVGEAAGAEEVREGYPFVQRAVAGGLFTYHVWEAGIDREQIILANTFRYRPRDNKVDLFFDGKRSGVSLALDYPAFKSRYVREPHVEELRYLEKMIRRFRPSLIVALGAIALWATTGRDTITKDRGKVYDLRKLPDGSTILPVPVLATFHPSYVSRQLDLGDDSALQAFRADLSGPLRELELQQGCPRELDWERLDDPLTGTAGELDEGGLLDFLKSAERAAA